MAFYTRIGWWYLAVNTIKIKINQSNCSYWFYFIVATCFGPHFGTKFRQSHQIRLLLLNCPNTDNNRVFDETAWRWSHMWTETWSNYQIKPKWAVWLVYFYFYCVDGQIPPIMIQNRMQTMKTEHFVTTAVRISDPVKFKHVQQLIMSWKVQSDRQRNGRTFGYEWFNWTKD
jgi:hypothetical protein